MVLASALIRSGARELMATYPISFKLTLEVADDDDALIQFSAVVVVVVEFDYYCYCTP